MQNKDSQEYKLVMSLYDSGKINDAERDKLLEALEGDGDNAACDTESGDDIFAESKIDDSADGERIEESGKSEVYRLVIKYSVDGNFAASEIKSVCANIDGIKNVRTDIASKTFIVCGDFDNAELLGALDEAGFCATPVVIDVSEHGNKIHIDMEDGDTRVDINNKPVGEYIKSALGKVSSFVGKGIQSVGRAGEKIARAVGDFLTDAVSGDGNIVRSVHSESYSVPYEKLIVTVKYVSGDSVFKYSARTSDIDKLKAKCVAVMSEKFYGEFYELIDEKFVGTFKLVQGGEVLKMTVGPKEE